VCSLVDRYQHHKYNFCPTMWSHIPEGRYLQKWTKLPVLETCMVSHKLYKITNDVMNSGTLSTVTWSDTFTSWSRFLLD